ncbi:unnamed protein product, partial [Mesorhabditis spiculigera]
MRTLAFLLLLTNLVLRARCEILVPILGKDEAVAPAEELGTVEEPNEGSVKDEHVRAAAVVAAVMAAEAFLIAVAADIGAVCTPAAITTLAWVLANLTIRCSYLAARLSRNAPTILGYHVHRPVFFGGYYGGFYHRPMFGYYWPGGFIFAHHYGYPVGGGEMAVSIILMIVLVIILIACVSGCIWACCRCCHGDQPQPYVEPYCAPVVVDPCMPVMVDPCMPAYVEPCPPPVIIEPCPPPYMAPCPPPYVPYPPPPPGAPVYYC